MHNYHTESPSLHLETVFSTFNDCTLLPLTRCNGWCTSMSKAVVKQQHLQAVLPQQPCVVQEAIMVGCWLSTTIIALLWIRYQVNGLITPIWILLTLSNTSYKVLPFASLHLLGLLFYKVALVKCLSGSVDLCQISSYPILNSAAAETGVLIHRL